MKNNILKSAVSIILSVVIAFSCFAVISFAADVTVITQPTRRFFYEGIDWVYPKNQTKISLIGELDISGTVLSFNGKTYSYRVDKNKIPNMYAKPISGTWVEGANEIRIKCDDFNSSTSYAVTTVNLVPVKSISVVTPPSRTTFVMNYDWNLGVLNDVEFSRCNLTGLTIKVLYNDGTSKNIKYPQNMLIGWSINPKDNCVYPGDYTLFATFCGEKAPFNVKFVKENPYKLGDASLDGKINSLDALTVLQSATGSITLDELQKGMADVNSDKNINSYDALRILQFVVGSISSF